MLCFERYINYIVGSYRYKEANWKGNEVFTVFHTDYKITRIELQE